MLGHGWETEAIALTLEDAVEMQRQLKKLSPYPVRTVKKRVRKDQMSKEAVESTLQEQRKRQNANKESRERARKHTFKEKP